MASPEPAESSATQLPAEHKEKDALTTTAADTPADNDDDKSDATTKPSTGTVPKEQDTGEKVEKTSDETNEEYPPLPPGPPPGEDFEEDDGWQPVWDATYASYYFYNSRTGETTWTNPRVPEAMNASLVTAAGTEAGSPEGSVTAAYHDPLQYNPAIHGDYDPTAPYAQPREAPQDTSADYTATAAFNRFTGKFTPASSEKVPENYNDENKSRRQMEFYFDVDAAANSHDGKSLKAERQTRKLTKKELKAFKEKRRARKEEKRKAWLKD
jgi:hypothetical protein